jgi:molybdopterin synthase catalytic subunit
MKKPYNRRTWLNPLKSDSTGAVVAFDGTVIDFKGKKYPETFLEISDCYHKIKLHKTADDTKKQFIAKMKLLKLEIDRFIKHLECGK